MSIPMRKNNDWLKQFKGYEEQAKRFDGCIETCLKQNREFITPFLNEAECEILIKVVGKRVLLCFDGGYSNAEKKRARLSLEENEEPFPISLLVAKYHSTYHELSHRDCMGALLNCGLRADQFGDIILENENIYAYVSEEIKEYVKQSVDKIKHAKVVFHESNEAKSFTKNIVVVEKIVSGLRLDTIVASCCNIARSKASDLIRGGYVQVNHLPLEDCSALCNNNAVLSIRGQGRFIFRGVLKKTKKEHYVIELGIFQ